MPLISIVISGLILAGLAYWLWQKAARNTAYKYLFWPVLGLKFCCGILIGWFYEGKSDTFVYQHFSGVLTQLGWQNSRQYLQLLLFNKITDAKVISALPFKTYSNSFFFVKLLSLLNFITAQNYYLNSLFLSLFCFAGCWYFFRVLATVFPDTSVAAFIGLFLLPTVVFWTAGILKESVFTGALGLFWGAALQLCYGSGKRIRNWILLFFAAGVLWEIKFFVAAFIFGLTGTWLFLSWLRRRFYFFRSGYKLWFLLPLVAGFLALIISRLHENFNLNFLLVRLVWNYELLQKLSAGRPTILLHHFEPNFFSVLKNLPAAVFGVLFRPFFWEGNSWFYKLAGFENLILFILFAGAFFKIRNQNQFYRSGFYVVLVIYILTLAATFGLATPNMGSLSRYRTAFLPFLVILLLNTPFWQLLLTRIKTKLSRPIR